MDKVLGNPRWTRCWVTQDGQGAGPSKMTGALVADELAVAFKIRGINPETWQHDRCQGTINKKVGLAGLEPAT